MRCILLIIVVLLCMNAARQLEYLGFGEMHPVYSCGLIGCECNRTIGIPRFGEMHPVYFCIIVGCECNQIIGIPRGW